MNILNINCESMIFCCIFLVLSIVVLVNLIDINMCKVSILREMCYFLSETFTRYSSNKTNVWQKIPTPSILVFSCEGTHEKL